MKYRLFLLRQKLLKPDDGVPSGTGATTTANPANPTAGGQAPNTQGGGAGAATGAVTTPSQAATSTTPPTTDANALAPKFTDADMAAARRAWEADAERQATEAARAAQEAEAIEQGKAKEVAAERLKTIHDLEGKIARMEPVLLQNLDDMTKDWPQTILNKKPTEGGYEARLQWYENYKDVAADYVTALQANQGQPPPYGGTGFQPNPPANGGGSQRPVDSYVNRTYGQPKKQ